MSNSQIDTHYFDKSWDGVIAASRISNVIDTISFRSFWVESILTFFEIVIDKVKISNMDCKNRGQGSSSKIVNM